MIPFVFWKKKGSCNLVHVSLCLCVIHFTMYQVHNIQDKCTYADEHNFSEFDLAFQTQNNLDISKLVDFTQK